jgi:hypothetical protein
MAAEGASVASEQLLQTSPRVWDTLVMRIAMATQSMALAFTLDVANSKLLHPPNFSVFPIDLARIERTEINVLKLETSVAASI